MKKSIFILAVLALVAGFAFANGNSFQSDVYGLSLDSQFVSYGSGLDYNTQITPYAASSYASDPFVPFLLNFLLGWGIGSFVQGDISGGVTVLVGDLISEIAFGVGYGFLFTTHENWSLILMIAGSVGILGFRIFECIRPFSYARNAVAFNTFEAGNAQLTLSPVIDIQDKNYGLAVEMKL